MKGQAFFAAVDWGTSSFRLWLLDDEGTVLAESRGPEGMLYCASAGFAPVLQAHLERVAAPPALPVLICGMAGAAQGWKEAPYGQVGSPLADIAAHAVAVQFADRDVRILPGVAQTDSDRPDVMRGEETQLLGLSGRLSSALAVMPGTHSKWAQLEDGAIRRFSTFMTGELFSVLSRHSILRHAVGETEGFPLESSAFQRALDDTVGSPAVALERLFSVRSGVILGQRSEEDSRAYLSGLLIGAEAGAARERYEGSDVCLIASGPIVALYGAALASAGFRVTNVDADQAVREGLLMAARHLWLETSR